MFHEFAVAADFVFEMSRVRFQAEYIWRRVDFEIPNPLYYRDQIRLTGDMVNSV